MSLEADSFVSASEEADSVDRSDSHGSAGVGGDKSNAKKIKVKSVKQGALSNPIKRVKIKALPMTCCVWYCKEKAVIKSKYCKNHLQCFRVLQYQAARTGNSAIHAKLVASFDKASSALTQFWRCTFHQ